jgi:hypothetical protein
VSLRISLSAGLLFEVINSRALLVFDCGNCYFSAGCFAGISVAQREICKKIEIQQQIALGACKTLRLTMRKLTCSMTGSTIESGARHSNWYLATDLLQATAL